ncbi:MAG: ornithine aminomutase subunit alpha [Bacillota bacterium]
MNKKSIRPDDFEKRRKHLKNLSDKQLKQKFWDLAEKTVDPLIDLAYKNTTPAIERSVLLRMGFSSLEAKSIVDKTIKHGLISKGAGHVVYKLSKIKNLKIRDAGLALINDKYWKLIIDSFEVKK